MATRPDYGLYLRKQDYSKKMRHSFYDFPIDHISLIDRQWCSTLNNIVVDGIEYAASFDFKLPLIEQLIGIASPIVRTEIMSGFDNLSSVPSTIEIKSPFLVGIEAVLGEPQQGQNEVFVPLIVQRFF